MRTALWLGLTLAFANSGNASEVTVRNDSLNDFGSGFIVWGWASGEMAESWLTSPCEGNIVATQILWRSPSGTQANVIGNAIHIYRSGTFPTPGIEAQTIGGPVLQDGVLNEWRYLDENNTIPLSVPIAANETFVVAYEFSDPPLAQVDPSVVRDADGNTAGHNALYARLTGNQYMWFDSAAMGVQGDWVIRAVINCSTASTNADVSVSMSATPSTYTAGSPLQYTLIVTNSGPAAAPSTSLVDAFPSAFQNPTWNCTSSGGATCPSGNSGNIIGSSSLPSGGQLTFTVQGTVAAGTSGVLSNTMTAVVNPPAADPETGNNTITLNVSPGLADLIFDDGFETSPP